MPRLDEVVNVLAIRQVKQGTETTRFRIGFTLHSCQYDRSWFNVFMVLIMLKRFGKIDPKIYQIRAWLSAGTGGHPESGTPSKVWTWALVCWSTNISKSSFTKKGDPPLKHFYVSL